MSGTWIVTLYIAVATGACIGAGWLGLYLWSRRGVPGGRALALCAGAVSLWSALQLAELTSRNLDEWLAWRNLGAVCIIIAPPTFACFAYRYTRGRPPGWLLGLLVGFACLNLALLWTNDWHQLVRRSVTFDASGAAPMVRLQYGPGFWVMFAYATGLLVASTYWLVVALVRTRDVYRPRLRLALFGAVAPWLVSLASGFGLGPMPTLSFLPPAMALAMATIVWGIIRPGLRDVSAIARHEVVGQLPDPAIVVNTNGQIVDLNPAAEAVIGSSRRVVGQPISQWLGEAHSGARAGANRAEIELTVDGATRTFDRVDTPLRHESDQVTGRVIVLRDVSTRKSLERALAFRAYHDPLTGLTNRLAFTEQLAAAAPRQSELVLMVIDLNRFKAINDTFGHAVGDQILVAVARRLTELAPPPIVVGRIGGDEFALFGPLNSGAAAALFAGDIMTALEHVTTDDGHTYSMGASIGIAVAREHGADVKTLLRCADIAMYDAKRATGGTVVYAPDLEQAQPDQITLASDFRSAIEAGDLQLEFQPRFDLRARTVVAVEARPRWRGAPSGQVSLADCVGLAERSGFGRRFTELTLDLALAELRHWAPRGYTLSIDINVSPADLADLRILDRIERLSQLPGLPRHWLWISLDEQRLERGSVALEAQVEKLRALGVRVALDNFSIGHGAWALLDRLTVDAVKLRVRPGQSADAGPSPITGATIAVLRDFGLSVIAKHVQRGAILQQLAGWGCDQVQGDAIAPAMFRAEFDRWVTLGRQARPVIEASDTAPKLAALQQDPAKRVAG